MVIPVLMIFRMADATDISSMTSMCGKSRVTHYISLFIVVMKNKVSYLHCLTPTMSVWLIYNVKVHHKMFILLFRVDCEEL